MKNLYNVAAVAASLVFGISAYAGNITINDGAGNGSGWYSATRENNEVEPGTVGAQVWDLESFDKTGQTLTMTGGYNFTNPAGYGGFRPGDLFIDVDGTGFYDYVAVIGNANTSYDIYSLNNSLNTYDVYYAQNVFSNPWRYKSGGTLISSNNTATYGSYSDFEGTHYTVGVDISWLDSSLPNGSVVTFHNTMECGNDNLLGQYTTRSVPDAGGTGVMFGMGMLLIGAYRQMRK